MLIVYKHKEEDENLKDYRKTLRIFTFQLGGLKTVTAQMDGFLR